MVNKYSFLLEYVHLLEYFPYLFFVLVSPGMEKEFILETKQKWVDKSQFSICNCMNLII